MTFSTAKWSIEPSGDRSLVVVFHHDDPRVANHCARLLAQVLKSDIPAGVSGIVPAMISVALHYAPEAIHDEAAHSGLVKERSPYACLVEQVETRIRTLDPHDVAPGREVTVPVCYGGENGPDLVEVARFCGVTPEEVIAMHTAKPVDVLAVGFAPGHPYVGYFDQRLSIGRRSSPRASVPAGSVAIANRQCVIYPTQLPGGWHLIGRTPLTLFDAHRTSPSLLLAGDSIRFVAIGLEEFEALATQEGGL